MPQKRISICTSFSVGSRREIVVEASGDVALAAENAFALYMSLSYPPVSFERYAKHAIVYAEHATRDWAVQASTWLPFPRPGN